ncbi:carboxypeptidase-like regulatory domain-containing protein [Myxococcus qinghaiensis]|uniref:carboxypeptidase-like regulatory domain-containing protein n=1 Tax=Myxococcus qinghaiensis TaxID=2906758 RepID=UPI0020A76623|nr:carboxypeptidase-like regulatory domain-containing protein [Myxococcus qinghaiensis]MCP3163502.1 carboxypeptidase-like regulatory domain-containing protein [Myxococcus qinghaiensis]
MPNGADTTREVAQAAQNDGAEVHNYVYTQAFGTGWAGRVYLPNVELWVRNVATNVDSVHVLSDANGFFGVPRQPAATYRLCWSAPGFVSGCQTTNFSLADETFVMPIHLPLVPVRPLLWGHALLRDGSVPLTQSSFVGVNVAARVRLVNPATNATVSSEVQVNALGQYAVGDAPAGTWNVVARVEADQALSSVQMGSVVVQRNLTFRNARPLLRAPVAWRNTQALRNAQPGETVRLTALASDADGDALTWRWVASAGSGVVAAQQGSDVLWTLPSAQGRFSVWAVVSDNRGGVATSEVRVSTQGPVAYFGGQVLTASGQPVGGARVTVGNKEAITNARGGFQLMVEESARYVLNVRATGFQLLSRILLNEAPEGQYRLVSAQRFTVNPQETMTLSARSPSGDQRPVLLTLQANSLVDAEGNAADQPLTAWLAPVDLKDPEGRMPGDLSAVDREGNVVTLTSFGALDVNIFDDQGRRFNLRKESPAQVSFPVDPRQAELPAGTPQSMPLWFYDESKGVWSEEGTLLLQGDSYVGAVPHFSVFNADIVSTGADCMRVHIDTARLPVPLTVRLTIPNGTSSPTVYTTTLDAALNAITRLPASTVIKIEVLDSNGLVISTATQNPSTGPGNSGTNAITVPYPYSVCTSDVTLTLGVPVSTNFLNNYGDGNAVDAALYYSKIDPSSAKLTLAAWKTLNGFGADDAAAYYFNNGDLGFGRSMHMKRSGANRAFYVTNHASVDFATAGVAPIATVAMEYSPHPTLGGTPYTKFYVFDAVGTRVDRADLDGNGDKFVPQLCNVCHGGDPFSLSSDPRADLNARFIPFDLESYRYSTIESPPVSGIFPFSRASQETQFRELNKAVLETNVTTTVQELVQGWYGGATLPAATQNSTYVQPNWASSGKSNVYLQVQGPSCRACHSTRENQLSWRYWSLAGVNNDFQERTGIYGAVCGPFRRMPHAKRTYQNFWLSTTPHQPNVLANAGIAGWLSTDPCPF